MNLPDVLLGPGQLLFRNDVNVSGNYYMRIHVQDVQLVAL